MNKKLLWIIISLVALVILLVVLKKNGVIGKEEGIKVSSEKVIPRDITEIVTASGKVYPEIEVKISPDVSGEITELNVEEGDSVRKGQVLARIYADIYATQRDQAAAQVAGQQSLVSNAQAQLEALKSSLELAKLTFNRQKQLLDDKVISRAEFEQADNTLKTAQANYDAALQSVRSNQAQVQSAAANLQKANKDLSRTELISPMTGVVSLLSVKKGERVVGNSMMAGTEMMRIADISVYEIRVEVGENDVQKIDLGDTAIIEVDAYNNRKFKGVVTQIASSQKGAALQTAASSTSSTDVTNYEVKIRILRDSYADLFDPAKPKKFPFRPGMSASADIQTNTNRNVLSVPINAVTTRDKKDTASEGAKVKDVKKTEQPAAGNDNTTNENPSATASDDLLEVVFVLQKDNTVKLVTVKTGIQDINNIEITEGLNEGDEVITGPYTIVSKTLKNKTKVKVVPKEQLFEIKN
ncbi:efflux RND transporter periplasmic adaptor subunit [Agriterribacter sp.]|uniref:efflux RND transporter periplasmic adaptor subunit n=1 Tax=Agriterribacter sp. TaxID=2821509 RepID=UPI002D018E08|nr:efflux RND transporter periplasmic adaptor subunit [Agriterribacter sp.]HRO44538.1 efflux RND transporter periplasmic adaptor subunit [Agriterribacter sp.]HRQ19641.1 efflux RND transporter periplasmic adaptor subunit [Agriterribacter sp.]